MHVVLRGLAPGFQHIRNSYAGAGNQNATTLEWLLDSNDAMDSATGPQAAFATQVAPCNMLNSAGRLHCQRPASLFDFLWFETNGNHFTEECRNLQRSKKQRKANRTRSKASSSKAKPQQGKPTDSAPAEFASEGRILSSSNLVTNQYWSPDTGATCHMTPHKGWGLSHCWKGITPGVVLQCTLCTLPCIQYTLPVLPYSTWLHFHWRWSLPLHQQGWPRPLSGHSHRPLAALASF